MSSCSWPAGTDGCTRDAIDGDKPAAVLPSPFLRAAPARHILQHNIPLQGDDFLSEHERTLRLEAEARRRAEIEALENLHRYRGCGGYSLILAIQRAKLGLPLSAEEQKLLSEASKRDSSIRVEWSQGEIADERLKALEFQALQDQESIEELNQAGGGGGGGIDQALHDLQLDESGGIAAATTTGTRGSRALPMRGSTTTTTGNRSGLVHEPESDETAEAGDASSAQHQQGVDPALAAEANSLMTLITAMLQGAGHAISLGDVSAGLGEKTGKRWGQVRT